MQTVVTVGLDIAKNVFQAHGIDVEGGIVFRRRLTRANIIEFFRALPRCYGLGLIGHVGRPEQSEQNLKEWLLHRKELLLKG